MLVYGMGVSTDHSDGEEQSLVVINQNLAEESEEEGTYDYI
jgi:hypothetical protein